MAAESVKIITKISGSFEEFNPDVPTLQGIDRWCMILNRFAFIESMPSSYCFCLKCEPWTPACSKNLLHSMIFPVPRICLSWVKVIVSKVSSLAPDNDGPSRVRI